MNELTKLLSGLSFKQRVSILIAASLVGGGILYLSHWRKEGDFRPLYTSLAPEDAATVVQKLKESAVEYRLAENGATVMVPSTKLAESRLTLAAAGLPKSGRIGFELFDKTNFGATEFVEHINYKRALEGELERSIMSLAEVEQARVHLSLPKESVFIDQQQPAKASVMVKLRPGSENSAQNVLAVTHLVASAVEGLAPDAVALLDMDGRLLSRPKRTVAADGSEMSAESMEVRQQIERNLVQKINATLEPLLGQSGFRAGASVDCDLTSGDQQEETLDPSHSVMVSSQKTEDATEKLVATGVPGALGAPGTAAVPGTASNLPAPAPRQATTGGGVSRRTENVTYQTSRVVRHTRIPQGVVRRMSLAVLVGQTVRWDGTGAARQRVLVPPSPETMKTIKDLVAGVTGFNAERGDQLIVESLPFESSLNSAPPPGSAPVASRPVAQDPAWVQLFNKNRGILVPVIAGVLVLLIVLAIVIRKLTRRKPSLVPVGMPDTIEMSAKAPGALSGETVAGQLAGGKLFGAGDGNALVERVRHMVNQDHTPATAVMRAWLRE